MPPYRLHFIITSSQLSPFLVAQPEAFRGERRFKTTHQRAHQYRRSLRKYSKSDAMRGIITGAVISSVMPLSAINMPSPFLYVLIT